MAKRSGEVAFAGLQLGLDTGIGKGLELPAVLTCQRIQRGMVGRSGKRSGDVVTHVLAFAGADLRCGFGLNGGWPGTMRARIGRGPVNAPVPHPSPGTRPGLHSR